MRSDRFRTLDDPPIPAVTAERIAADLAAAPVAGWQMPAGRPGWLRRLVVWMVLGWKWN